MALKPEFAVARSELGNLLTARKALDEAIAQYRRALEIKPDYAEARNNLGNALVASGRLDEAIEQYRQALAINPDYIGARQNLDFALTDRNLIVQAIGAQKRPSQPVATTWTPSPPWPGCWRPVRWNRCETGPRPSPWPSVPVSCVAAAAQDVLDALAAAYAETGRFTEAAATAQGRGVGATQRPRLGRCPAHPAADVRSPSALPSNIGGINRPAQDAVTDRVSPRFGRVELWLLDTIARRDRVMAGARMAAR